MWLKELKHNLSPLYFLLGDRGPHGPQGIKGLDLIIFTTNTTTLLIIIQALMMYAWIYVLLL